ncbi:MAG: hypothetical protein ACOC33_00585 [bacterium]
MFKRELNDHEKIALMEIGMYFKENVKNARIHQIYYEEEKNIFHLQASYPGLLIGKKGNDYFTYMENINNSLKSKGLIDKDATINFYDTFIDIYLNSYD